MDVHILTWLKDGKYRVKVLKLLKSKTFLPSELAKELDLNRASISRILKQMKEKKLIDSISAGSRTVSYRISEKGKQAMKFL
ncbi:winged helix-turn-helix transcriptional regulator [Candidatus Woesearchaeota archaeon]|nr:winged helix-turn-helix transcriptional regulator [Candidatus Woesearchaeota archaeon]